MKTNRVSSSILRYIDEHIGEELSTSKIAKEAGYSEFHFSRIFKDEMEMTLQKYVTRRKLIKASEKIIAGQRVIDAAFQYGWKTHAGFTKSFKKEFGFSPSLLRIMLIEIQSFGGNGMSHVFLETTKSGMGKEELFEVLLKKVQENGIGFNHNEMKQIYLCADRAYVGKKRYSGEDYVTHPLNVAILLADLGADKETIYAGMFCDVMKKGNTSLKLLKEKLPEQVIEIIIGVEGFDSKRVGESSEEVVLIKLAERLHNMQTMQFMKKTEWKKKAEETVELFLPMARQIENQKLIDELNDLSIKYM